MLKVVILASNGGCVAKNLRKSMSRLLREFIVDVGDRPELALAHQRIQESCKVCVLHATVVDGEILDVDLVWVQLYLLQVLHRLIGSLLCFREVGRALLAHLLLQQLRLVNDVGA